VKRDRGAVRAVPIFLVMLPLAVSGPTVIGVAVVAAVLLAWVLLRADVRDDAREEDQQEP
jgi:ABC-type Fe3+ transport system permease subunit